MRPLTRACLQLASKRLPLFALAALSGLGCQPDAAEPGSGVLSADPKAVSAPSSSPPRRAAAGGSLAASTRPVASSGETLPAETPTIRFRDATADSGITFVHCSGRTPEQLYPTLFGSGVAMIDYDGDGLLDLYLATNRNLPLDAPNRSQGSRLYRNLGAGKFEDVTDRAGVGFRGFTNGVAVADVNNDGSPDLYLANFGPNVLYLNNGDGTFRDATAGSGLACGVWSSAAAFLDYDGDGRLDLYVSCYGQWTYEGKHPFCGDLERKIHTVCSPTTIVPERHFLFRNRGNGTFEDTTRSAGILRQDGRGMGVVAADLNRDGRIDLFVANDLCPNFLFLNKGDGKFEDVSEASGAACSEAGENQSGMGVDIEDLTGDGLPELVVSHYRGEYCALYRNLDGANFQDVSAAAGIVKDSLPYVGWGCALADFDNDGQPDLMVVNGHVEDNLLDMGRDIPYAEPSKVWHNEGSAHFRLVADPGPFFSAPHVARGAAFGDLDNDGDLDVVVSLMDARPVVLFNESVGGHWIRLDLVGHRSNRSAIGAV
ncbi:MAG TPA: VCBS repeat-containing protein, partial [Isosphaeraceae bacterium]|nr:VCBS repeat-containing protein [Isosphaeraceae bacterium]